VTEKASFEKQNFCTDQDDLSAFMATLLSKITVTIDRFDNYH